MREKPKLPKSAAIRPRFPVFASEGGAVGALEGVSVGLEVGAKLGERVGKGVGSAEHSRGAIRSIIVPHMHSFLGAPHPSSQEIGQTLDITSSGIVSQNPKYRAISQLLNGRPRSFKATWSSQIFSHKLHALGH